MAKLVICEKPSVALDVSKALPGPFTKTSWGYQSADYWVSSAMGHLLGLLAPQDYDAKYKNWVYADLPIIPSHFMYQPNSPRARSILNVLKSLEQDPQITGLVNACDAGREGEGIFFLIYQWIKSVKPVERAWFNSMTPAALQESFASLSPSKNYEGLRASSLARAQADWLVGMNASRAASLTLGGSKVPLSIGRVQTPTLALIVNRDIEIDEFVSQPYQTLKVKFSLDAPNREFSAYWRSEPKSSAESKLFDPLIANKIVDDIKAVGKGTIANVKVTTNKIPPPKLYDLTSLQRQANKSYGLSAQETLSCAQKLYEEHKVLTYPRTDSKYITSDMSSTIPDILKQVVKASADMLGIVNAVASYNDCTRIVNDAKVTDHHAIIPTNSAHDLSKLSGNESKVYKLVVRRFLESLLPDLVQEQTVVWVSMQRAPQSHWFVARGTRDISLGWKEVSSIYEPVASNKDSADEEEQSMPPVSTNEVTNLRTAELQNKATKAKEYHNDASILLLMETAGKLVDDQELSSIMKDKGLGTPATRASIIENIIEKEYVLRAGKTLTATDKGRSLILSLGDATLASPELTGEWELKLREIEKSKEGQVQVLHDAFTEQVLQFTIKSVTEFADKTYAMFNQNRKSYGPCPAPSCAGFIVRGKSGWGCSSYQSKTDSGCGFVFWFTQGDKKMSITHLQEYMAKVSSGQARIISKSQPVIVGPCPRCASDVIEKEKSWGCSSYQSKTDSGCGYVLWKESRDVGVVSLSKAQELVNMKYDPPTASVTVFSACPLCSGSVMEREKFYGCNSYKSTKSKGCGLLVWKKDREKVKTIDAVKIEIAHIAEEHLRKKQERKDKRKKIS